MYKSQLGWRGPTATAQSLSSQHSVFNPQLPVTVSLNISHSMVAPTHLTMTVFIMRFTAIASIVLAAAQVSLVNAAILEQRQILGSCSSTTLPLPLCGSLFGSCSGSGCECTNVLDSIPVIGGTLSGILGSLSGGLLDGVVPGVSRRRGPEQRSTRLRLTWSVMTLSDLHHRWQPPSRLVSVPRIWLLHGRRLHLRGCDVHSYARPPERC